MFSNSDTSVRNVFAVFNECPRCGNNQVEVSTRSKYLQDLDKGDVCKCTKCGLIGRYAINKIDWLFQN